MEIKCQQCKSELETVEFDIGYNVKVKSFHCKQCGFNITDDKKLKKAINKLKENMAREVKIIAVGEGLGLRFPNEFVNEYRIKKGEEILLKPELDCIKLVLNKKD